MGSAGAEAADLAASVGLYLAPWQRWVLESALQEDAYGKWTAFECALIVARQNGKNAILEALELAALFLWGERLVVHSAHKFNTAQEHFLRMKALMEESDDLARLLLPGGRSFVTGNGKEQIRLKTGQRLLFVARSGGSARGFSGDRVILDEAFDLPPRAVGSMMPALRARPNPQIWYSSSPAHVSSVVLHGIIKRIWNPEPGDRLFGAMWGNEPGVADDDVEAWLQANPSMGVKVPGWDGIAESTMWDEYRSLVAGGDPDLIAEFRRELLGINEIPDVSAEPGLPLEAWSAACDRGSTIDNSHRLALDVSPDKSWASFAIAGYRKDGLPHVELVDRRPGTAWITDRAKELTSRWGGLRVDARSAAAAFVAEMRKHGVTVDEMPGTDLMRSCGALEAAVLTEPLPALRHIGQDALTAAVEGASRHVVGDGQWSWSRLKSTTDISPLVAVTLAFGALPDVPTRPIFAY